MKNELTNVMALTMAIETLSTVDGFSADVIEKLGKIKTSYEKKSGKVSKAELEKQALNETLRNQIIEAMSDGVGRTITEMIKGFDFLDELSISKVSALCKPLVTNGTLARETVKGKSVYTYALVELEVEAE